MSRSGTRRRGRDGRARVTHYDWDVTELPARPATRATPPTSEVAGPVPGPAGAGVAAPAVLLTGGVLLVAASLRPLASTVGPLVHPLRADLHLNGTTAGLLLTIPVLCFGAIAPLAPLLSRRVGIARTVALILLAIAAGLVVRVSGGIIALFAGTTLAAAGAACGNVLLPVLVRRSFSDRIGRISALYTTVLVGTSALAAGVAVPLAHLIGDGWRGGLGVWALPVLVALGVWLPQLPREPAAPATSIGHGRMRDVTRDPITWSLTLFFAAQSWGFYTLLAWMPSIFESHGVGSTSAGLLLGLAGIVGVPVALLIPRLATRSGDQRWLALCFTLVTALGYVGLLVAPAGAPELWALLIGLGQGACFPLALTMIVLRSGTIDLTASLSTHVQSIGYLLAAAGPLAMGALHDATGSWTASIIVLIVLIAAQALTGAQAGRARVLRGRTAPASA